MTNEIKLDSRNYRKHGDKNRALINDSLKNLGTGRSVFPNDTGKYVIYIITNVINGKIYIGCSVDYKKRFKDHLRAAKNGCHYNLHKDIRKFGLHNFTIEPLCSSNDKTIAYNTLERHFIKILDSTNNNVGYNMVGGGFGFLEPIKEVRDKYVARMIGNTQHTGHKHSPETKAKMSEWQKGRKLSPKHCKNISLAKSNISDETRKKMSESGKQRDRSNYFVAVCQISTDDKLIKTFPSIKAAEKETGVLNQDISKVCKGKRKTAGGYKWMHERDYISQT